MRAMSATTTTSCTTTTVCGRVSEKRGHRTRTATVVRAATAFGRREALAVTLGTFVATTVPPAGAFDRPPPGFTRYNDSIDGYAFIRPSDWIEVKGSGNDVFFRDPTEVETNCFVGVSSPSSSSYETVRDLGKPEEAAKKVLNQYLLELTSTRLGVRRESEILSAVERVDKDGKPFYDVKIRISSYSARNQYGLTPEDRPQTLEWDRTLRSALGTENGKLYELRLQSPTASYEKNSKIFDVMVDSFRQFEADTPSVSSYIGLRIGQ